MKRFTGIVAIAFMAGLIGGGVGQRITDEIWTSNIAHAASDKFSARHCREIADAFITNQRYWNIIYAEHC